MINVVWECSPARVLVLMILALVLVPPICLIRVLVVILALVLALSICLSPSWGLRRLVLRAFLDSLCHGVARSVRGRTLLFPCLLVTAVVFSWVLSLGASSAASEVPGKTVHVRPSTCTCVLDLACSWV